MSRKKQSPAGNEPASNGDVDPSVDPPSKSARKREMSGLQILGEGLVQLDSKEFAHLELDPSLLDAIQIAKKISAREGKRRQLQYIGKLMRKQDEASILAIRQFFEDRNKIHHRQVAVEHEIENWRDRMIKDNNQAIQEFLEEYPLGDRNQLRQLARASVKEQKNNQPPASQRKLYQLIKSTVRNSLQGN